MDAEDVREAVEAGMETELRRLGSEKLLIALTGADLTEETVLAAAAGTARTAADTFEAWAAAESDGGSRDAFAGARDTVRGHADELAGDLPDDAAVEPLRTGLDGHEGTTERVAAGLVGWPLVAARVHGQAVSFFINEADTRLTGRFRAFRDETEAIVDDGASLVAVRCRDEDDRERALRAAERVIETAYDDYAGRLADMGLDPRPIC